MRVSKLSSRSGVSVPTIKFYAREGLLPERELTSPNQASYGDEHVARLRLVRALIDVGGLSVASVRAVLAAVDDDEPIDWVLGRAQRALPQVLPSELTSGSRGDREVEKLLDDAGWTINAANPGRSMAAQVVDSYERLGHERLIEVLPEYLRAAEIVANADLAAVADAPDRSRMVETVVVGTVLGDTLFAGLRRMAQERRSRIGSVSQPATTTIDNCDDEGQNP